MSKQENCEEGIPAHCRDNRLRELFECFRYTITCIGLQNDLELQNLLCTGIAKDIALGVFVIR
jgi:hypothetical protein